MLRIAEGAGGGLERNERHAGDVALLWLGLDDPERGGRPTETSRPAPLRPVSLRSRRYASDAIHAVTIFWNGTSFMNRTKISSF